MIFKFLQGVSEFVKMEYGENRVTEYYDRAIKLRSLTFLRKLKNAPEEKAYEILKYSMLPFILIVFLSYELTWKLLLPEDNAVRYVLSFYLMIATFSLYPFEKFKRIVGKSFKLLWILFLFTLCLAWLYHEGAQTEEDIMMEGYRHIGPPYATPLHEPGFFQKAYLGMVELVIYFLILVGLNYLLGRFVLKVARWFAKRAFTQSNPDVYLQKYLDYLIVIPCVVLTIAIRYMSLSFHLL